MAALFADPWNPTYEEVLRWAYDADSLEPDQDFRLALSRAPGLENAFLELASDDDCPKRRYFLSVLYLMVGDAIRADTIGLPKVEALIARAQNFHHPDLQAWSTRSKRLVENPETFNYDDWCAGGYAYGRASSHLRRRRYVVMAVSLSALLVVGWLVWQAEHRKGTTQMAAEVRKVRIVVDASVVEKGDPYAIIDPVWWSVDIYGSLDEYEDSLQPFSDGQREVHALFWYVAEVNNGGHDQFYFNSTGIVWPDALAAFNSLGLKEGAEILWASAERLGGSPDRDRSKRQAKLGELDPDFDDLDERFYEFQGSVNLDAEVMKLIRKRPSDFYFDGIVEKPKE